MIHAVESPLEPVRVFLSYSHQDEKHINELRKSIKVMERNGLIAAWHDRELSAGEKWNAVILQVRSESASTQFRAWVMVFFCIPAARTPKERWAD